MNNLGNFYSKGIGTKKNDKEAFKWYLKSAEGEITNAYYTLAGCYEKGIGIKKDEKKAFKWYSRKVEILMRIITEVIWMLRQRIWNGKE
jgi:TPR repeat protein